MEYKGTVLRLMDLLEKRAQTHELCTVTKAFNHLIDAQIDRVKVNVMTHMLDAMTFFNKPSEHETCERCGITAADVQNRVNAYDEDVHNDPDSRHTVCDECDY